MRRACDAIAAALAAEGVEHVFCVLGDGNLDLLIELADRHGVQLVHARHEQGAAAMADGYSRRTGRIGVCSVTHGPGLTQTATSLKVAVEHRTSVLLLAGDTPSTDPLHIQSFEQRAFVEALGAAFVPLRAASRWAQDLTDAVASAASGRPTVFNAPVDYQFAPAPELEYRPCSATRPPRCAAATGLGDAAAALGASSRPVILAGRGAIDAAGELAAIAELLRAPVVTTIGSKGLLAAHPHQRGMIGSLGNQPALQALGAADCVLAVGASLNPWATKGGSLLAGARVIQIDSSASAFGRFVQPDIALLGDAHATLRPLVDMFPARDTEPPQPDAEGEEPEEYEDGEGTVDPRRAVAAIEAALAPERTIVFDGGHFLTFACGRLNVTAPERYLFTGDFATIGQGLGNAIGASVASPNERTTLIAGDGGLLMSIAELDTAVRYQLPLNIVVLNDEAYGQEVHSLAAKGLPTEHAILASPDLAALARAYGADGHLIRACEELDLLSGLLTAEGGPRLIDIRVNRTVVSPAAQEIFRQVREALPA